MNSFSLLKESLGVALHGAQKVLTLFVIVHVVKVMRGCGCSVTYKLEEVWYHVECTNIDPDEYGNTCAFTCFRKDRCHFS